MKAWVAKAVKMPARKDVDDMRPEYDFDYSKALP